MLDQHYFAYDSKAPLALTALSERIKDNATIPSPVHLE